MPLVFLAATETVTVRYGLGPVILILAITGRIVTPQAIDITVFEQPVAIVPVNIEKLWLEPRTLAGLAGDVDIDTGVIARGIDIHIGVVIRNADFEHREISIGFIRGGRTASNGIRQGARTDGNKEYERKRDDGGPLDASGHVPPFIETAVGVHFITRAHMRQ